MESFQNFLLIVPVLLFSIVAHEYAHGWVAMKNGDMTAYSLGRLTWNPLPHIDPFMSVIFPLVMYLGGLPVLGAAKPVPVNPRNYRNFKRGDIQVSLAGIVTNLIIAALLVPSIILLGLIGHAVPSAAETLSLFQKMFATGIIINLGLAAFNLIPIPPLDGSHVLKYLLPPAWGLGYQRLGRFGIPILLLLLWFGGPVLSYLFAPVFAVYRAAMALVFPYILPSQWTM
ncbi:MAG: site-2 protease family protein [Gemmatimonadota bacterium]|nr:site-2 protease family protein [Gemmatimonadota bacterium]